MYITIDEFGDIRYTVKVPQEIFECADDGIYTVIDIAGDVPKDYFQGEWTDLKQLEETT